MHKCFYQMISCCHRTFKVFFAFNRKEFQYYCCQRCFTVHLYFDRDDLPYFWCHPRPFTACFKIVRNLCFCVIRDLLQYVLFLQRHCPVSPIHARMGEPVCMWGLLRSSGVSVQNPMWDSTVRFNVSTQYV